MKSRNRKIRSANKVDRNSGMVLLLTLVVLMVLTAIVYSISSQLAISKHRQEYLINYQKSRYACDSAMKYALATIEDLSLNLADNSGSPDFSDVFAMTEDQYKYMMTKWAMELSLEQAISDTDNENPSTDAFAKLLGKKTDELENDDLLKYIEITDDPDSPEYADMMKLTSDLMTVDPNTLVVPGPYGPPWPFISEPIDIEIGDAKVTIEITDENAKMPLSWAISDDKEVTKLAEYSLDVFCEWMYMAPEDITELKEQIKEVQEIKAFKLNPRPITIIEKVEPKTVTASKRDTSKRRSVSAARSRRSRVRGTASASPRTRRTIRSVRANRADFARLFNSSMLDRQMLGREVANRGKRKIRPIDYLGLWGSQGVNVNTAPRHVLEAAFTFGGNARDIVDEIIKERRIEPFEDIDDLKSRLYRYSTYIDKTSKYLTTKSYFLAIKATARCGNAQASAVATVIKSDKQVTKIVIMSY